jgi:copper chaperone CopZ
MKITTFFIALCLSAWACAARVEVDVKGMTCSMCVSAITNELKSTDKVENINVDLEEKKTTFSEIKGKKISDAEVRGAIKKAGYEAGRITRR